eukprot:662985-Amphidinium_carterae.1
MSVIGPAEASNFHKSVARAGVCIVEQSIAMQHGNMTSCPTTILGALLIVHSKIGRTLTSRMSNQLFSLALQQLSLDKQQPNESLNPVVLCHHSAELDKTCHI